MRQLLYVSTSTRPGARTEIDEIFDRSRHNNAIDGVTGLLYTDGARFLQVIEGPEESVAETFARIEADPRHQHIAVLTDRHVDEREFGYWAMAQRSPRDPMDSFDELMRVRLTDVSDEVRDAFLDLVTERHAA